MKKNHIYRLVLLVLVSWLGLSAMAQTAIERLKQDYPAVMEQYGKRLEAQKADYVIAIDVSGTMMRHTELVLPALYSFIDALPDGDYLSIIKFGTIAQEVGLSGKVDETTRDGFKRTLSTIYQRDPQFVSSTDLSAMCDAILTQMSRPGGNDLKYIFMFTDFINESGASSKWQSMRDRVSALYKMNIVRSFAMQLPGSGSGRDIQLVRDVFPNLQTIDVNNSAQLNEWFEGQKADISKERLKDLIRGDLDQWYSEGKIKADLVIGLDRGLRFKYIVDEDVVPAFINGVVINNCELISKSNNVENVVFAMDSAYKGRNIKEKIGSLKFFNKSLIQKDVNVTMAINCRPMFLQAEKDGEPSFANDIRNLGLEEELARTMELKAENAFVFGWNIWLVCALALLLLVFLYYFVKMTVLPYKLDKIVVSITNVGNKKETNYTFEESQSQLFGKNGGIDIPQADFVVEIYGRRGFPLFMPRAIMFKVHEEPAGGLVIYKDNKNISKTPMKIKVGDTLSLSQGILKYNIMIK